MIVAVRMLGHAHTETLLEQFLEDGVVVVTTPKFVDIFFCGRDHIKLYYTCSSSILICGHDHKRLLMSA